jgi:hypothetical protein
MGRVGLKEGAQRPVQDLQLVPPPGEVDMNRRSDIVRTAQVDHGQSREEREHPRRAGVETEAPKDPTEMQPVAGEDRARVRH